MNKKKIRSKGNEAKNHKYWEEEEEMTERNRQRRERKKKQEKEKNPLPNEEGQIDFMKYHLKK